MPSAQLKAVYVPRFGSQSSSLSQRSGQLQTNEYLIELPSSGQRRQDGLGLATKKVKLTRYTRPKVPTVKKLKEDGKARLTKYPVLEVERMTANVRQAEGTSQRSRNQCSQRGDPRTANEDVFTFLQRDRPISNNTMLPQQPNARLSVLRTISRMLQENRVLRERLVRLTQNQQQIR